MSTDQLLQVSVSNRLLVTIVEVAEMMIIGMAGGIGYRIWSKGAVERAVAIRIGGLFLAAVLVLFVLDSL